MIRLVPISGLAVALALWAMPAAACPVCIDKPEATVADRLLSADAVVMAREDPDQPFTFAPVAALKGEPGDGPIPLLLDSTTRRLLDGRPADGVVLIRDGNGWSRVAYADTHMLATVEAILSEGPEWRNAPELRFAFFEALLERDDDVFRHIAIDELSRARYGLIRTMARPLDGAAARGALIDRNRIPWAGFYVLMLGLSDRAEDHALIRDRIVTAARFGADRAFDAWATALIEIDGEAGVGRLVEGWFEAPGSKADEVRAVIAAFEVHAREGDPATRAAILSALRALPARRPEVGGSVAAALGAIGDFSQADAIRTAMLDAARMGDVGLPEPELMAASFYVNRARRAGPAGVDGGPPAIAR